MKLLGKEVDKKYPEDYNSNFIQQCRKWDLEKVEEIYPEFYKDFRYELASKRIIVFEDYFATGCGVAVNFLTKEVLMIDFRN